MFVDVVFPKGNEEKFISVAEKLGYSGLVFVYDFSSADVKKIQQRIEMLKERSKKIGIYLGFVAKAQDCTKARNHCELVLLKSSDKNHDNLEKRDFDVIFDLEMNPMKDTMHFRSSGLNQVLCNIAAKKKKIVGINFRNIIDAENKPKIIGRIMQNIKLCKKYKTQMVIFSGAKKALQMKGYHDLTSFMVVFGMKEEGTKKVLKNCLERVKENMKKKTPEYLKEGVEIIK